MNALGYQSYVARMLFSFVVFGAVGCCVLFFLPLPVSAAAIRFPDGIYPYSIVEQDIAVVLREFGQNLGIRVKLSPKVSGAVKGKLPPLPALGFLNHLCQTYGLEWYFDGSTLHISSISEEVTRFLPLNKSNSPATLIDTLKQLSFYDERYPLRPGPDDLSIVVTGPPVYVGLIEQTLSALPQGAAVPAQTVIYRGASVSVEQFGATSKQ